MLLFLTLIIVIVLVAAYYTYIVKQKPKREGFTQQYKQDYIDFMNKTFKELLNREPTTYELSLYAEYQTDKPVIVSKIKTTGEYSDRHNGIHHVVEHFTDANTISDQTLENYRQIINVYNKTLDRMPTKYELEFYESKMRDGFSTGQLQTVLESSREYFILQKNQSNVVNGELPGNKTDAQVTLDVRDVYQSIYGAGKLPSEYLEDFLKRKYVEYNLDQKKLKQFILLLRNLDNDKDVCTNVTTTNTTTGDSSTTNTNNGSSATNTQTATNTEAGTKMTANALNAMNASSVYTTTKPTAVSAEESTCQTKQSFCQSYLNDLNTQFATYPYDEQYSILYKLNNGKDGLPKQCTNRFASIYHRDLYAEEIQKRNKNEQQFACDRSTYFANEIDNGILSNTKLSGTPLFEAADTKIGSIMPKFEYKNLS